MGSVDFFPILTFRKYLELIYLSVLTHIISTICDELPFYPKAKRQSSKSEMQVCREMERERERQNITDDENKIKTCFS